MPVTLPSFYEGLVKIVRKLASANDAFSGVGTDTRVQGHADARKGATSRDGTSTKLDADFRRSTHPDTYDRDGPGGPPGPPSSRWRDRPGSGPMCIDWPGNDGPGVRQPYRLEARVAYVILKKP